MKKITGDDPTPRQFVKDLLPSHYIVKETTAGHVSCSSNYGIRDADEWDQFMKKVRQFFGESLKEVYHYTCTYHIRFVVYYDHRAFNPASYA